MVKSILTRKQAQGWGFDLIAAIIIFLSGVIVLYVYAINYTSQSQDDLQSTIYEANLVSELILSETNLGILTDGKVNNTKLADFNASYDSRKASFGLKKDFYVVMQELPGYIGRMNTTQTQSLIEVERVTIYNNTIVKLLVYVWE